MSTETAETKPKAPRAPRTPKPPVAPPSGGEMDLMMSSLDNLDFSTGSSPVAPAAPAANGTTAPSIPVEQVNLAATPGQLTEADLAKANPQASPLPTVYLDQLKVILAQQDKKIDSLLKGVTDLTQLAQGPQQAIASVNEVLGKVAAAFQGINQKLEALAKGDAEVMEVLANTRDTMLDFLDAINRHTGNQLFDPDPAPEPTRASLQIAATVTPVQPSVSRYPNWEGATEEKRAELHEKLLTNIKGQTQTIAAQVYATSVSSKMPALSDQEIMNWLQRNALIDPAGNLIKG